MAELRERGFDFRPKPRLFCHIPTTPIDQDTSGTYNPRRLIQRPSISPSPPKRRRVQEDSSSGDEGPPRPTHPKVSTWRFGRWTGDSLVVTLRLTSEPAKAFLNTLGLPGPSSPEPVQTNCEEQWLHDMLPTPSSGEENMNHHRLPPRRAKPVPGQCATTGLPTPESMSPASFSPTLGHPEARGCYGCLELAITCPLLEDHNTYPCEHCVAASHDCVLITPPTKKRACEGCRKSRAKCSYRHGDDHSEPCQRCRDKGAVCIAGPEPEPKPEKTSRGGRSFVPTAKRPFLKCTPCRISKKYCSLTERNRAGEIKDPPCHRCIAAGTECTFEAVERNAKKVEAENEPRPANQTPERSIAEEAGVFRHTAISTPDTGGSRLSAATGSGGETIREEPGTARPTSRTTEENGCASLHFSRPDDNEMRTVKIQTSYAHPISFGQMKSPCHFCHHPSRPPSFGMFGLGQRKNPTGMPPTSPSDGFTEISGGYVSEGAEPTKMCSKCTSNRLSIVSCVDHQLAPIPGLDKDSFDLVAAWASLLGNDQEDGRNTHAPDLGAHSRAYWCSICPTPAFFQCIASGAEDEDDAPDGCGLLLCQGCESLLETVWEGNLDKFVAEVTAEGIDGTLDMTDWDMGVRADVAWLHSEGELFRRLQAASGEEE